MVDGITQQHVKTYNPFKVNSIILVVFCDYEQNKKAQSFLGEDHLGIFYYPGEYDDCNLDLRLHFHL